MAGHKCEYSHDVDLILERERHGQLSKRQRRSKKKLKNVETLMDTVLTVDDSTVVANGCTAGKVASEPVETEATDCDVVQSASVDKEFKKVTTVDKNSFGHRAGFDAFMTGCVFAWSVVAYRQKTRVSSDSGEISAESDIANSEFVNRVYLGGKDFPLHVTHSCFAKPSKCHLEKWQLINSTAGCR